MPIRVVCRCGKELLARDEAAGTSAPCPACGKMLTIARKAEPPPRQRPAHPEPGPEPDEAPARPAGGAGLLLGLDRVARWYWMQRKRLSHNLVGALPGVHAVPDHQCEIHLSVHDTYENAVHNENGWAVELPDCCVSCGQETDRDWQQQTWKVDDLNSPLWFPVAGLVFGILTAVLFLDWWAVPVLVVAGFVLGYVTRKQVKVRARFRRCRKHAADMDVPEFLASAETLVLRVGHRRVKQFFLKPELVEQEKARKRPPPPEPEALPVYDGPDPEVPKPIPLADMTAPGLESLGPLRETSPIKRRNEPDAPPLPVPDDLDLPGPGPDRGRRKPEEPPLPIPDEFGPPGPGGDEWPWK